MKKRIARILLSLIVLAMFAIIYAGLTGCQIVARFSGETAEVCSFEETGARWEHEDNAILKDQEAERP